MIPALLLAALCCESGNVMRLDESTVDVAEVNSLYTDDGVHTFDQLIGWDFTDEGYRVAWWKLIRDGQPMPSRGRVVWIDGTVLRKVRYRAFRRTFTQYDPELLDREKLPQDLRRGL